MQLGAVTKEKPAPSRAASRCPAAGIGAGRRHSAEESLTGLIGKATVDLTCRSVILLWFQFLWAMFSGVASVAVGGELCGGAQQPRAGAGANKDLRCGLLTVAPA